MCIACSPGMTPEELIDILSRKPTNELGYNEITISGYAAMCLKDIIHEHERMKSQPTFPQLQSDIHMNAVKHGWYDKPRDMVDQFQAKAFSVVTELAEASKEIKSDEDFTRLYRVCKLPAEVSPPVCCSTKSCEECQWYMWEGFPMEIADTVIRLIDYAGYLGIDLWKLILMKHEFNKLRPYRHGGKVMD